LDKFGAFFTKRLVTLLAIYSLAGERKTSNVCRVFLILFFSTFKKPTLTTLAGFDLATLKLQSPRWQADTIPLGHASTGLQLFSMDFYASDKPFVDHRYMYVNMFLYLHEKEQCDQFWEGSNF
jgi:hypothetical protein